MKNISSFSFSSILFLLCISLIGWNCGDTALSGKPGVSGAIKGAEGLQVFLDLIKLDNSRQVIGKVEAGPAGEFAVDLPEDFQGGLYNLRIGQKRIFLPLDGTEKGITVNGDLAGITKYDLEVKGSAEAETYVDKMKGFFNQQITKDQIAGYITQPDAKPMAAMFLATSLLSGEEKYLPMHDKLSQRLKSEFPEAEFSKQYTTFTGQLKAQIAQSKASGAVKLGQPAPDIKADDPKGKSYALSDLKGKIVLLDFWASWCGPCRRANPHVVETYKKYKDQGFTVFSVSLDGLDSRTKARYKSPEQITDAMGKQKKRWVDAIKKDKLEWDYHVSDLKKWESAHAASYGVRSIPKTFLIDRDGNIASINPRNNLESELKKLL